MNKRSKILIQLIILVLLITGLFFYFTHQTNEESPIFPELSEIKFEPAEDLDPSLKKEYAERFIKVGETINQNPNDLNAWLSLGSIMKKIKDYKQAEKIWLYLTERWPDDPVAFGNLADLYSSFLVDYSQAEWYWKKAVANSKNIYEALIYYRNLHEFYKYYYQEKADLADDILLEALKKYPNEPDFIALLAVYYRDTNDKTRAIEYFEKLLEVDPTNQAAQRDLEELR